MNPENFEALFEQIARQHLGVATLTERHSDRLDFHDVSVLGIRRALQAAFEAGQQHGHAGRVGQ
ncbi:hypothetical protein C5F52_14205 [Limnohabitans sp. TS-CS-82]|uniref:DUF6900 domain-containing protein n=1 Tax=Limnohabitans sp. TS-CS-82 TaxID=2094193 RepID=UPI000CF1D2EC|nr:hypothetical protein [Limnohabitans sp. TS-CS-82]PQA82728.1 hypothetical protein C5F52_14205 [Limnohabitans sp. TS-CS-82]